MLELTEVDVDIQSILTGELSCFRNTPDGHTLA